MEIGRGEDGETVSMLRCSVDVSCALECCVWIEDQDARTYGVSSSELVTLQQTCQPYIVQGCRDPSKLHCGCKRAGGFTTVHFFSDPACAGQMPSPAWNQVGGIPSRLITKLVNTLANQEADRVPDVFCGKRF